MSKLLLNADGKVLTSNDKVLKAPEVADILTAITNNTLTEYTNSDITAIKAHLFYDNDLLINVNFPNVTSIGTYSFFRCYSLTTINIPLLTIIGTYAFSGCILLKSINFPLLTVVQTDAFRSCHSLTSANLPSVTKINNTAFYDNYSLIKVYIEQKDKLCSLSGTSSFKNCYHFDGTVNATYNPNGLKDGYIYVPASRLAEYKVATNWVTYESQIIGHEDFEAGATLPNYTNETFTTQTWYSDETLTTVVTSVATAGKYYCRLEA